MAKPNSRAFILWYAMIFLPFHRLALPLLAALLASAAPQAQAQYANAPSVILVPQSQIQPADLLQYAYQRWQVIAGSKYQCEEMKVLAASNYKKAENGNITEVWQTEVCGKARRYTAILVQGGDGNIIVAFSEKDS